MGLIPKLPVSMVVSEYGTGSDLIRDGNLLAEAEGHLACNHGDMLPGIAISVDVILPSANIVHAEAEVEAGADVAVDVVHWVGSLIDILGGILDVSDSIPASGMVLLLGADTVVLHVIPVVCG